MLAAALLVSVVGFENRVAAQRQYATATSSPSPTPVPPTPTPTPTPVQTGPGGLDASFGVEGRQIVHFINRQARFGAIDRAHPQAVVVQPDGKIVVAGYAYIDFTDAAFALARFNPDGSFDQTFGTGGVVTTHLSKNDEAYALALQPDGKIVAAGSSYTCPDTLPCYDFALVRYNPDGTLDPTFDGDGKVTTAFGSPELAEEAHEVLIQPDGKIVAVGLQVNDKFALARYNPNGSLDETFGDGGRVLTNFGSARSLAFAAVLQPDGKIVAAGDAFVPGTSSDFALARYNTDGSLDPTFGVGGKVTTDFNRTFEDFARALILQPDGKIVAGGWSNENCVTCGGDGDSALARYNPDGTLDLTFGVGGRVTVDFAPEQTDQIWGLALQANGKIVSNGSGPTVPATGGSHSEMAVGRFTSNGQLDPTFGEGGRVLIDFGIFNPPTAPTYGSGFTGDSGMAVTIQPDGKIVAVGYVVFGRHRHDFGIARLNGDPRRAPPPPPGPPTPPRNNEIPPGDPPPSDIEPAPTEETPPH
jgi:uncharacterized delta-60 repeat protein